MKPTCSLLLTTQTLLSCRVVAGLVGSTPPNPLYASRLHSDNSQLCSLGACYHRLLVVSRSNDESQNGEIEIEAHSSTHSSDAFAHLVDSNPFDDPEPPGAPSNTMRSRRQNSNPYDIPDGSDEKWEWFFSKLKARSADGLSSDAIEESILRHWMADQRKSFMKTLGVLDLSEKSNWGTEYLSLDHKRRLDELGFEWGHLQPNTLTNELIYSDEFQKKVRLKYKDWMWNPEYERLRQYYIKEGHTNIPFNNRDGLGVWTARQRRLRWEMPERRRERLDDIHFQWDWKDDKTTRLPKPETLKAGMRYAKEQKKKATVPFPRRISQLKDYRIAHGDCRVPIDYGDGLGEWVKRLKGQKYKLTPRTIVKLESIGFEFDADEADTDDTNRGGLG